MASLSEARLLIFHKGIYRKLCKIFFSKADASIYITPYSYANKYHYGQGYMPENVERLDLKFKEQFYAESIPKISIHQTGQVHIKAESGQAGPVYIPKLDEWSGQHIATIQANNFDALPEHTKQIKTKGRTVDIPIGWNRSVDNGRIVLYADSGGKNFPSYCNTTFSLRRPTMLTSLNIGVGALANSHNHVDIPEPSMVVIAGWDPTKPVSSSSQFLYIQGS